MYNSAILKAPWSHGSNHSRTSITLVLFWITLKTLETVHKYDPGRYIMNYHHWYSPTHSPWRGNNILGIERHAFWLLLKADNPHGLDVLYRQSAKNSTTNPLRELHVNSRAPRHKVMNTSNWYLYKLSSYSLTCMAHLNISQAVTAVLIGFILQVYLHFMKGSIPLSQNVILDSLSSYSGEKARKKMDKKWLMLVIIFTILSKYSTLKILFILFLFGPLRDKTLGKF